VSTFFWCDLSNGSNSRVDGDSESSDAAKSAILFFFSMPAAKRFF